MTSEEIMRNKEMIYLIPQKITIRQYYILLFEHLEYMNMFWKSVMLTITIVIVNSVYSILVGCILGKGKFKGRVVLISLYLFALIMPYQITMLPHYIIFKLLNILETDLALILTMALGPFGVVLITFLVQIVPDELIEYTLIETDSLYALFRYAIFPSIKGVIIILIIFIFCEAWNMVEQPLTIYSSLHKQPLSVILGYISQDSSIILPASTIYMFPVVIMYFFFHESLEESLKKLKV